jgi:hypothetical protein
MSIIILVKANLNDDGREHMVVGFITTFAISVNYL